MKPKLRCAIYTRKSSEEGLEQDFNSLHAQREACEAYVRSQVGEGWAILKDAYDDGGFSGGTMERPGLRRLLADIASGTVDVVVVYKVDRLTRSLTDFAKIVDAFDAQGVSFVSVTQSFNTTSSMGRLTLNVLLSFAQFEREVTGERIRDKIAASKAKGMWMGGIPPLGYDAIDRKLVINPPEAQIVRSIFTRYLEMKSARLLAFELEAQGVRSKAWMTRSGKQIGGVVLSRGAVFHILQSRIYLGEIVHKEKVHPGQHEAIIDRQLFEAVAAVNAEQRAAKRSRPVKAQPGPLAAKLFDADGQPLSPSFSYGRGGRLYRYYIAMPLQIGGRLIEDDRRVRRVSAPAIEDFLVAEITRLAGRPVQQSDLARLVDRVELRNDCTHVVLRTDAVDPGEHPELMLSAIRRRLHEDEQAVAEAGGHVRVVLARRMCLRGGRAVFRGAKAHSARKTDPLVVAALKRSHQDLASLNASPLTPSPDLHKAVAPPTQYQRRLGRLAFLSPEIQSALLRGSLPTPSLSKILDEDIPLAWADQKGWLEALTAA